MACFFSPNGAAFYLFYFFNIKYFFSQTLFVTFVLLMKKYPFSWLSFCRVGNMFRLVGSYALSVVFKRPIGSAYPYAASFEPANYCNLSCPQCPTGRKLIEKTAQQLSYADFCYYVDALSPYLMYLNLYFQGEPFLNRHLPQMIRYAHAKKVMTCVSTNAHFLTDNVVAELAQSGIDRLIICLDGATQASYEKYRVGGNFNKVVDAIKRCVDAHLPVEVQCLLLESTENEQKAVESLVRNLGVTHFYFKKAQFYDDYLLPQNEENRRYYQLEDGKLRVKKAWKNRCFRMFSSVIVDVNGNLLPCCYDKFGHYSYGNIKEQSFRTVYWGEKAMRFRKRILVDRSSIDICRNCTE